MKSEILIKLSAARTRLILEQPFIGSLVMHLPLAAEAPAHCPTIATDALTLYFNPEYVAGLTLAETQFVLAHEALHCALGHFARRLHRIRKRWDIACDHAVNLILLQEGMRPPAGALANRDFLGLTAEEIYPLIPADAEETTLDGHLFHDYVPRFQSRQEASHRGSATSENISSPDSGAGEPMEENWDDAGVASRSGDSLSSLSGKPFIEKGETLVQRWQSRLAAAAQAATRAGRLSSSLARSLEHLIEPQMPWRVLLARYLVSVARDDYSFLRSSRREGNALLPRLASGEIQLVIALDTSGSIGTEEMQEFTSEVDALKGQVRANLVLHACDDHLCADGPWHFAPWEHLRLPETLRGGGGTRFTPVFAWVEREGIHPDLLIYFSDAQGEFPAVPPAYPVIWLVKGRAGVPWGERIQLN